MASDPTSPVAPARINALILPVGKIKNARFQDFFNRIRREDAIRLGDISPDTSSDKTLFSPVAFPNGSLLYNFTQSLPNDSHLSFSPFELFREPLLILCVADYAELFRRPGSSPPEQEDAEDHYVSIKIKLQTEMQAARDRFPRALHVQLIMFDADESTSAKYLPLGTKRVPQRSQSKSTVLKTIMCDVSALLLAELSLTAASIQQSAALVTPGATAESVLGDGRTSSPSPDRANMIASRRERISSIPPSSTRGSTDQLPSSTEGVLNTSRPSSPASSDNTNPSSGQVGESQPESSTVENAAHPSPRPRSAEPIAGAKRDRKSMPVSIPADRARVRLKARQGILLGSLFLLAGRWPDALRELVENSARAKAFADHRWFAKGLENILVAMLLLARADMEFTIPPICFTQPEKSSTNKHASANNSVTVADIRPSTEPGNRQTLLKLSSTIPEIVKSIMSSHARADIDEEGTFPSFILSDCIIRIARLYAFLHRSWGILDKRTLEAVASSHPKYSALKRAPEAGFSTNARRREISFLIFRAFPDLNEHKTEAEVAGDIIILSRMASVLSFAGLDRKQAIVQRQMLSLFIPSFIQARKRGAAELGVHPAASLSIAQTFKPGRMRAWDEIEKYNQDRSLRSLVSFLFKIYGVKMPKNPSGQIDASILGNVATKSENNAFDSTDEEILRDVWLGSFGNIGLKYDILRLCTNLTEALPDFEEVLRSISTAFGTVGPTRILPLPANTNLSGPLRSLILLPEDEQNRLASKFYRLVESVPPEDIKSVEAVYWDPFLLRNIELEAPLDNTALFSHHKSDFKDPINVSGTPMDHGGPFLHNAYSKVQTEPVDQVLVAGELANFLVTLQNPFSFEIFIEQLIFITEGVALEQELQSFPLGPCVVRKLIVTAIPSADGKLGILGCRIKVRGCQAQDFSIFREYWSATSEVKFKKVGIRALLPIYGPKDSEQSGDTSIDFTTQADVLPPKTTKVSFNVIAKQPILEVVSSSFPQSNLTLLAGQTVPYSITLRNISADTTCDFVSVSFKQAVHSGALPNVTLGTKEPKASASDVDKRHEQIAIGPGESKIFEVDVFGVPGLTEGFVFFDYACIGGRLAETVEKLYTRQIKLELQITVNPTIQLLRAEAVPLREYSGTTENMLRALLRSNTGHIKDRLGTTVAKHQVAKNEAVSHLEDFDLFGEQGVFVLLLDLRNLWSWPLRIKFYLNHNDTKRHSNIGNDNSLLCSQTVVQTGQGTRIALPVPRIFADGAFMGSNAATLEPQSHKLHQSAGHLNAESSRSEDWYKEALLNRISGGWEDGNTGARGWIDLQGLRLNPEMADTIHQTEMRVDLMLSDGARARDGVRQSTTFKANQLLAITVNLRNKTSRSLSSALVLNHIVSGKVGANDSARHVAWTGAVEHHVPILDSGKQVQISSGVTFMSPGRYEIVASAYALKPITTRTEVTAHDLGNVGAQETPLLGSSALMVSIEDENA